MSFLNYLDIVYSMRFKIKYNVTIAERKQLMTIEMM